MALFLKVSEWPTRNGAALQSAAKKPYLRIGTRGSPLALVQARQVRALLAAAHHVAEADIEIVTVSTAGDRSQVTNRSLSEIGGKGLFSKEIEDRLLAGDIDLAVHSAKDMATRLPDGLVMPAFLARADVRDAFLSTVAAGLDDLRPGAIVGTSSLRRRAQLLRYRPDLKMIEFRGNLGTRMQKLADGLADATLLAAAGLIRLGETVHITSYLDETVFLPAPAQGAIGLEFRADDQRTAEIALALNHEPTAQTVAAERAMLAVIDGSCRTPIGVLTRREGDSLHLVGQVLSPDGATCFEARTDGAASDAARIGGELGAELLASAGPDFIAALKALA